MVALLAAGCATAPDQPVENIPVAQDCSMAKDGSQIGIAAGADKMPAPCNPTLPVIKPMNCTLSEAMASSQNGQPDDEWILLFDFASTEITQLEKVQLDKVAARLTPTGNVRLIGHTDSVDSKAANMALASGRVIAVRNYLIEEHDISPSAIHFDSKGEAAPRATNRTIDGRRLNRRVEVQLYSCS